MVQRFLLFYSEDIHSHAVFQSQGLLPGHPVFSKVSSVMCDVQYVNQSWFKLALQWTKWDILHSPLSISEVVRYFRDQLYSDKILLVRSGNILISDTFGLLPCVLRTDSRVLSLIEQLLEWKRAGTHKPLPLLLRTQPKGSGVIQNVCVFVKQLLKELSSTLHLTRSQTKPLYKPWIKTGSCRIIGCEKIHPVQVLRKEICAPAPVFSQGLLFGWWKLLSGPPSDLFYGRGLL